MLNEFQKTDTFKCKGFFKCFLRIQTNFSYIFVYLFILTDALFQKLCNRTDICFPQDVGKT